MSVLKKLIDFIQYAETEAAFIIYTCPLSEISERCIF